MKKFFISVTLLLSISIVNGLPQKVKTDLGNKISVAIQKDDLELIKTLLAELDKYKAEESSTKDLKWINNKITSLTQTNIYKELNYNQANFNALTQSTIHCVQENFNTNRELEELFRQQSLLNKEQKELETRKNNILNLLHENEKKQNILAQSITIILDKSNQQKQELAAKQKEKEQTSAQQNDEINSLERRLLELRAELNKSETNVATLNALLDNK